MSNSGRQGCQHLMTLHSTKPKDLEKTMYLGLATTTFCKPTPGHISKVMLVISKYLGINMNIEESGHI